ncbi:MAG: hypothetical protein ACP5VE_11245 [Chthonomonadales bacterium]
MGIGPTDLPVTPIREGEAVRRVEREAEARDLGQRQPPGGEGRKKRPAPKPQPDAVEISTEPEAEPAPPASPAQEAAEQDGHRLDITA